MEQAGVGQRPFLVIERYFPVAPEKVWRAWTDPRALKRWFGPGGYDPVSAAELDLRAGGRYRIVFGGADGTEHEVRGEYREVVPHRRLVFTWTWPRSTPERESLVTIELQASAGGTAFVFRHERFFDETVRDDHRRGWRETFAKLEAFLAGV